MIPGSTSSPHPPLPHHHTRGPLPWPATSVLEVQARPRLVNPTKVAVREFTIGAPSRAASLPRQHDSPSSRDISRQDGTARRHIRGAAARIVAPGVLGSPCAMRRRASSTALRLRRRDAAASIRPWSPRRRCTAVPSRSSTIAAPPDPATSRIPSCTAVSRFRTSGAARSAIGTVGRAGT